MLDGIVLVVRWELRRKKENMEVSKEVLIGRNPSVALIAVVGA